MPMYVYAQVIDGEPRPDFGVTEVFQSMSEDSLKEIDGHAVERVPQQFSGAAIRDWDDKEGNNHHMSIDPEDVKMFVEQTGVTDVWDDKGNAKFKSDAHMRTSMAKMKIAGDSIARRSQERDEQERAESIKRFGTGLDAIKAKQEASA